MSQSQNMVAHIYQNVIDTEQLFLGFVKGVSYFMPVGWGETTDNTTLVAGGKPF